MRLTYIADGEIPSGAANCVQVLHSCVGLMEAGADVTLYARRTRTRLPKLDRAETLRRRFGLRRAVDLHYVPFLEVRGRLQGSYFNVAAIAARLSGRSVVMTRSARVAIECVRLGLRVILETHSPPNTPRLARAVASIAKSPQLLLWIFISERLRELHADVIRDRSRTVVLHSAVDIAAYSPMLSIEEARARLGVDQRSTVLLHSGSLYAGRGAEQLVGMLSRLPDDAELWFVGGRQADIDRVRAVVPASRSSRVRFWGHKPVGDLPLYSFAANVLLMPYTSQAATVDGTLTIEYASPMKLFEYLASARPIVATSYAGVREVAKDGENALLAPTDDFDAFAGRVGEVLSDRALADRLSAGARRTAERHTWEARGRTIVELSR